MLDTETGKPVELLDFFFGQQSISRKSFSKLANDREALGVSYVKKPPEALIARTTEATFATDDNAGQGQAAGAGQGAPVGGQQNNPAPQAQLPGTNSNPMGTNSNPTGNFPPGSRIDNSGSSGSNTKYAFPNAILLQQKVEHYEGEIQR